MDIKTTEITNERLDTQVMRIDPSARAIYTFCQTQRDHYLQLDMELEAKLFADSVELIEETFTIPSAPALQPAKANK